LSAMQAVSRAILSLLPAPAITLASAILRCGRSIAYHTYVCWLLVGEVEGLHLGSGGARIPRFWNLDANPWTSCNIVAKVERIKLKTGTVGTIYASHVLEHIPRDRAGSVLEEWHRVLRPGGKLYVSVPDLEVLFRTYLDNLPHYDTDAGRQLAERACYLVYGGQANRYEFHLHGYSFASLGFLLERVGFVNVQRFDRAKLDFVPFRDISLAEIDGVLMSLNVEATKK